MSLLSRPFLVSEKMAILGSDYDLGLIDFSAYFVAIRSDLGLQVSDQQLFRRDTISFRLLIRCDAMPSWNEPLTLRDGTTTVSPSVTLV